MRRVTSLSLASLLLVAFAPPVSADATPIDERRVREDVALADTFLSLAAGEACEFPIEVEDIAGKVTSVFITEDRHGNILDRVIFHTTTRYTNVDTGTSFERRYDSVVNFLARPDGTAKFIGRNDVLTWYPEETSVEQGPGAWLVEHGRLVEEYDAEGTIVSGDFQEGEIIDVCALLG